MEENMNEPLKPTKLSRTRMFLIMESVVIFIGSLLIYLFLSGNWIIFLVLLSAPAIFIKEFKNWKYY